MNIPVKLKIAQNGCIRSDPTQPIAMKNSTYRSLILSNTVPKGLQVLEKRAVAPSRMSKKPETKINNNAIINLSIHMKIPANKPNNVPIKLRIFADNPSLLQYFPNSFVLSS
jgi:hypothetical protein